MTIATVISDLQTAIATTQAVAPLPAQTLGDLQTALATAQSLSGPPIDPRLVNLADNTALDLGPMFPTMTIPNGENAAQVSEIIGNSGMAYDAKRLQFVISGGGHSCTNDDTVLRQQLTDLMLIEDYKPTPAQPDMVLTNFDTNRGCWLVDISHVGGPYPRPAARHTGAQLAVWNDELILFGRVEGNGARTQQSLLQTYPDPLHIFNSQGQIAHYDLSGSKAWTFENASPTQTDGNGGVSEWGAVSHDPTSGLFIWLTPNNLYTYDPVAQKKVLVLRWGTSNVVNESGVSVANTIDIIGTLVHRPVDDKHYFFSRGIASATTPWQPWRLDFNRSNPSASKLVRLSDTGQRPHQGTPSNHTLSGEQPVRYDARNDVFGTGPWSSTFYVFDPKTKAWSHQAINGAPAGLDVAALSHMMEYSPEANIYFFLTDWDFLASRFHRWAYRYKS